MPRKPPADAAGGASAAASLVAYYRVSTDLQGRSGLGIEAQKAAVAEYAARAGAAIIHEFEETESGKRNDRPQLAAALAVCRARRATLVVAKIDRLARNARFLLRVAEESGEGGVAFCDLPQLPVGPMGKFFLTVMAAIAELERGLISERTKAALAQIAEAILRDGSYTSPRSGNTITRLGNPRLRVTGASVARKREARRKAREVAPAIIAAQKAGCTKLVEIAAALSARGIKTPGGNSTEWRPEQVRRVLKRMETLA